MEKIYQVRRSIDQYFEQNNSSLEYSKLSKEVAEDKNKETLTLNVLQAFLTYLSINKPSKRTQLHTLWFLSGGGKNIPSVISFNEVRKKYEEFRQIAQIEYPKLFTKTDKEQELLKMIKVNTRMKIDTAVFLGRSSVDMYMHALGTIIEVDGNFHDHEGKMIRDNHKAIIAHKLGIKFLTIKNEDIKSITVQNLIKNLCKKSNHLNSTKRREIYLSLMIYALLDCDKKFLLELTGIKNERLSKVSLLGLDKVLAANPVTDKELKKIQKPFIRY